MKYIFPFNTCEKPNKKGIAQPYSAFFNLMNCLIVLYFLVKTKTNYAFLLLASILCFELFHVFSHSIHIPGSIQTNTTHVLSYCINFAFLLFFYKYVNILPSTLFIIFYLFLISVDIYLFLNMDVVYYLFSQALLFFSVLFYYYSSLPQYIRNKIHILLIIVVSIIILFINEKHNCKRMLKQFPHFPFHILIEIMGIIIFYIICSTFYKL